MQVVLAHPTGNTFVRAAARALARAGRLGAFVTTIAAPSPRLTACLPARLRRQLARRRFEHVPAAAVRTRPLRETIRLTAAALGVERVTRPGAWASIDAVYEDFDRWVARRLSAGLLGAPGAAYAYEDASEQTFRAAHARGIPCVYELPIAYWETTQRVLREEAERLPQWRPTLRGLDDPASKLARKAREIELADVVVVPSRFVLDSLPDRIRASRPCVLAPFGSPLPQSGARALEREVQGRLRILFAGAMTQRKGLADVFAAMRLLDRRDVELVVMGSALAPMSFYRREFPAFVYEPPRPHHQVLALMRSCDVLVLPALVEGRALVQQEALASGLPVVTTANAGGDDLVEEGRTGFLVPIRAPETIAERLAWLADHRSELPVMRQHALRKAAETDWAHYEARVVEAAGIAAAIRPAAVLS
jgi:glycosyltransferase involved in cell wall biosynthesis